MIPDFLTPFKTELEKYKLSSVKIEALPTPADTHLPITQSKFLGHPFLPLSMAHPKDKKGQPMIMLAQINFAEAPLLDGYPDKGIIQLFVSPTDWYDMTDYAILYHEDISAPHQTDFSFLTKNLYEDSPIPSQHRLVFLSKTEYGGMGDVRCEDMKFNGQDYYDLSDTLPKEQQDEMYKFLYQTGHKIGGYAYFTQEDPRGYDKNKKKDILLFQIDSEGEIMFGDAGVANVFIKPEDLRNKNFDRAYFNWDCC